MNIISSTASLISEFLSSIGGFIVSAGSLLIDGITFIFGFFGNIPNFIINNIVINLPPVFKEGLYGVICVMLIVLVIKIYSSIKL